MAKPSKLAAAYDEIVAHGDIPRPGLTHLSAAGSAHMVDVSGKALTDRSATASASVRTTPEVIEAIAAGAVPKGDVLAVARIAGLLAAKRTPDLLPLCHPVQTTGASVELEPHLPTGEVRIRATVRATDRTGVEMEAMMAASTAALAVYDMIKSLDRWACVQAVQLEAKRGGKSGDVKRPADRTSRSR
jgi:cyclic pyranopterin phosphate synthase